MRIGCSRIERCRAERVAVIRQAGCNRRGQRARGMWSMAGGRCRKLSRFGPNTLKPIVESPVKHQPTEGHRDHMAEHHRDWPQGAPAPCGDSGRHQNHGAREQGVDAQRQPDNAGSRIPAEQPAGSIHRRPFHQPHGHPAQGQHRQDQSVHPQTGPHQRKPPDRLSPSNSNLVGVVMA